MKLILLALLLISFLFNLPNSFSQTESRIGKLGKIEKLPKELQEKETMSKRKPLSKIIMNGKFNTA